jgi:prolipoprotein diacylglyceryltransferase
MGQVQSVPLIIVGLALLWMSRRAPVIVPQPMVPVESLAKG